MSTRNMKKLYGDDGLLQKNNEDESDAENSIIASVKFKTFNVFDVLNQNSENGEKDSEEQHIGDESSPNQVKHKKKRRRRKRLAGLKVQQPAEPEVEENVDEIERTERQVNKLPEESVPGCSLESDDDIRWLDPISKFNILKVKHKHLNPYNELKRIFGSKTVQAEQSNGRNRGRSGHLRKTWLVSARENWPPISKFGLSMSLDQTMECTGDFQYFMFDHSASYRQTQLKFLEAVESLNPANIVNIVNTHSYHIDTLLQLSELCKLSEDLAMAAEFAERALYYLECAFHPLFNVTTARCRLDYRKQQNRPLFMALFKHLSFVGGRACYRTSLEFCKLLLSLDPEGDPLAVILMLDFYALKAKEYQWLDDFCNLWNNARNLTHLPNIAYSLALAQFYLGNESLSEDLLENALIMFPGVLMPLLEKCNIQTDAEVTTHDFFKSTAAATTLPALEKLESLYVARCFHFWKEADILPWLQGAVHNVLDRIDDDGYIKYCQEKRSKWYKGKLPKNILRHIILSDIKDVTINIQEVQNTETVLLHDPLPPNDSIDIYKTPTGNVRATTANGNILSLVFSSLFTDINRDAAIAARDGLNLFYDNDEQT